MIPNQKDKKESKEFSFQVHKESHLMRSGAPMTRTNRVTCEGETPSKIELIDPSRNGHVGYLRLK